MWGGPAHQDTWDLKPDAPAEIRGEFRPISTRVPGIQICEHLPLLAERTDKLAIVRSMTHGDVNHLTATHYLLTGQAPPPDDRAARRLAGLSAPCCQSWDAGAARCRRSSRCGPSWKTTCRGSSSKATARRPAGWARRYDPLSIDANPAAAIYRVGDFDLPPEVSRRAARRAAGTVGRLEPAAARHASRRPARHDGPPRPPGVRHPAHGLGGKAPSISRPSRPPMRERYGLNPHGQSVLQARRLVEAGVPLVTVFWPSDGIKNVSVYWDTHNRNFVDLKTRLMPPADQRVFRAARRSGRAGAARRHAGRVDGRVRPHAQASASATATPGPAATDATIGPAVSPRCWPAAASAGGKSMARRIGTPPIRPRSAWRRST